MPTAARKQAMLDAASGTAGIVIGTHALLSDNVSFYDLGLIVVDEQHRFGVEQRDVLRSKASKPPHLLVMTATPIPRTVAMTVFGDLETSILDELPAGRAPDHHPRRRARGAPGLGHPHLEPLPGRDRRRPPGLHRLSQDRHRRRRRLQSRARPNRPPRTSRATAGRANWRP